MGDREHPGNEAMTTLCCQISNNLKARTEQNIQKLVPRFRNRRKKVAIIKYGLFTAMPVSLPLDEGFLR